MLKLIQTLIFFCLSSWLFAQEVPNYYKLLKSDNPNIHEIHKAYNAYYQNHEWKKDEYFRAYREFIRAYPLLDFDETGNPIKPSFNQLKSTDTAQVTGGEWKALPVKIDRNDCYYTGQNGVISAADVPADNPNIVYTGTLVGELFKSSDKGLTWSETLVSNLPEIGNVNNIKIAPSNSSIIYAATDAGLIKSTDAGNTFDMTTIDYRASFPNINYGGDDYRAEYMYVDVATDNPDKVAASDINPNGLNTYIAVSQDGGQTWNKYDFGYKNFPVDVKFHPSNSNIIYTLILDNSTKNFSFYKSNNSGQSFQQITNGFPANNNPNQQEARTRIALSQAQPNLVALYFHVNGGGTGFYKSTNSGTSFTKVCCGNANDVVNTASGNRDFFGEGMDGVQIRWATKFAISDTDPDFVVAATNRAPRFSFNQMQDWYWTPQQVNVSNQPYNVMSSTCGAQMHGDIKDIIIRGNDVWIANDGGLVLSENKGETFTERADGIPITMALGFDMTQDRRDVIVAAMDHNGVIVRDQSIYGENWKPMGGGDASNASINPIDNFWFYGRPSGDVLFRRPETGPSHNHPNYTGLNVNLGSGYVGRFNNVQFHPNNYHTLYIVDYQNFKIKKSTDNGITWQDILDIQSGNGWSYAEVKVSHSNPDVLYVADYSNGNGTLNYSSNGGQTWNNILPNMPGGYAIRNIEIDSEDPNIAWLTLNNNNTPKVYKTTDAGTTWTDYSTGLGGYRIFSIVHQKGSNQGIYTGTRDGVYYTNDTLSSWVKYGTDMDGRNISFLKINYAHNVIRAGTTAGIWENDLYESNAPQANISMDKNEIGCGEIINFADHSAAGKNATYSWNFSGGVPETSTDERPTVIYPDPGSYSVTLTVTDENGTDTYTYNDIIVNATACTDAYLCNSAQISGVTGIYASSEYANEGIAQTLDGNPSTHWHNNWPINAPMSHTLDYNLGELYSINGLRLLNRASNSNGFTKDIELYASIDNANWTLLTSTSLPFTYDWQTISFPTVTARYFRIKILSNQNGNNVSAIAEIEILGHSDTDGDTVCDFRDDCPLEYGNVEADGCCSFFTTIDIKASLQGTYDTITSEMSTQLNQRGLLPGQTPVSGLANPTPAGQPYDTAPWNYRGTEGLAWDDADYTGDETDWVLASFRTGIEKNTQVGMTAGLLKKDGSIDFPNRCALFSSAPSPLYIVLEHRNHIGIMTPQPIDIIGDTLTYDFRLSDSYRDATSFGQQQLPTGEWVMFAGDADQSDFPSFDINGTDKTIWFDNNGVFDYYFSPDFNLDGDVNGQDKSLWFDNNGISSRVPK